MPEKKTFDQKIELKNAIFIACFSLNILEKVKKFDCKKSILIAFLDELGRSFFGLRA